MNRAWRDPLGPLSGGPERGRLGHFFTLSFDVISREEGGLTPFREAAKLPESERRFPAGGSVNTTSGNEVTKLLARWGSGDAAARDALIPLVYNELYRMARHFLPIRGPGIPCGARHWCTRLTSEW